MNHRLKNTCLHAYASVLSKKIKQYFLDAINVSSQWIVWSGMIQTILVVCIGNICRSPIGEALFVFKLKETHPEVVVTSAGIAALVNHPADPTSQLLMKARNIDISGHRARQTTPEILFGSDLILTMTTDQQTQIEQQHPSTRGRVHRLGKWGGYDVPDPYKRSQVIFEQALVMIDQGVDEWYTKLWN